MIEEWKEPVAKMEIRVRRWLPDLLFDCFALWDIKQKTKKDLFVFKVYNDNLEYCRKMGIENIQPSEERIEINSKQ